MATWHWRKRGATINTVLESGYTVPTLERPALSLALRCFCLSASALLAAALAANQIFLRPPKKCAREALCALVS